MHCDMKKWCAQFLHDDDDEGECQVLFCWLTDDNNNSNTVHQAQQILTSYCSKNMECYKYLCEEMADNSNKFMYHQRSCCLLMLLFFR